MFSQFQAIHARSTIPCQGLFEFEFLLFIFVVYFCCFFLFLFVVYFCCLEGFVNINIFISFFFCFFPPLFFLSSSDSPSVKAPYTASITVPEPLVALMSAISKGNSAAAPSSSSSSSSSSTYAFEQTIPVPSYLIAFAIGKLEVSLFPFVIIIPFLVLTCVFFFSFFLFSKSREISDRCRVWCESKRIEVFFFFKNNQFLS